MVRDLFLSAVVVAHSFNVWQVPLLAMLLAFASAVVTPISASKIGRHTIYTNNQAVRAVARSRGHFSDFFSPPFLCSLARATTGC